LDLGPPELTKLTKLQGLRARSGGARHPRIDKIDKYIWGWSRIWWT